MSAPDATLPPSPDLEFGAFSEHGPWVLDVDDLPWRWEIDRLRGGTRQEVPRLLAPGRLPPFGRLARTVAVLGSALAGWFAFEYGRPQSRADSVRRDVAPARLGDVPVPLILLGTHFVHVELAARKSRCLRNIVGDAFALERRPEFQIVKL